MQNVRKNMIILGFVIVFINLSVSAYSGEIILFDSLFDGSLTDPIESAEITGIKHIESLKLENISFSGSGRVSAKSGSLNWFGLPITITDIDGKSGQLVTQASAPNIPLGKDKKGKKQSFNLEFDLDITSDGPQIVGSVIKLNEKIPIGPVTLNNIELNVNPEDKTFTTDIDLDFPNPENSEDLITLDAKAVFDFNLPFPPISSVQTTASGLNIDLGYGVFLQSVNAGLKNIHDIKNITLEGGIGISGGPELQVLGEKLSALSVDAQGSLVPLQFFIDLEGSSKLFSFETSDCKFSYRPPYNVTASGSFNPGMFYSAHFDFGLKKGVVSGGAEGDLHIPNEIKIIGGITFAKSKAGFKNTTISGSVKWENLPKIGWKIENGNLHVNTALSNNAWETPYNIPFSVGEESMEAVFMTNWTLVDKATTGDGAKLFSVSSTGASITTLKIPDGVPSAIFLMNYENTYDLTDIGMTLITPEGKILNFDDGILPDGFDSLKGFSNLNTENSEAFFFLSAPSGGWYKLYVNNSDSIGNFTVEALVQNHAPEIEIISVENTGTPGQYFISWSDKDLDDNAQIQLHLDTDREGYDGYLIATIEEDENTNYFIFDADQSDLPSGYYYVYASIDDGSNGLEFDYHHDTIFINNPYYPEPVKNIAVLPENKQFTIQWEKIQDPDITEYIVVYTDDDDAGMFEGHFTVDADVNITTINEVENGVPLLVSVFSRYDNNNRLSYPETVLRVVPKDISTPPHIISIPPNLAEAGTASKYFPRYFDTSLAPHSQVEKHDLLPLKWKLFTSPDGMSIDENGLITWTPSFDQVGVNSIAIELTGHESEKEIIQRFDIDVLPAGDLHGDEEHPYLIVSQPILSAFEDSTYEYMVKVNDEGNQVEFSLLRGPEGMTIDNLGYLSWQVPNGGGPSGNILIQVSVDGHIIEHEFFLHVITADNVIK